MQDYWFLLSIELFIYSLKWPTLFPLHTAPVFWLFYLLLTLVDCGPHLVLSVCGTCRSLHILFSPIGYERALIYNYCTVVLLSCRGLWSQLAVKARQCWRCCSSLRVALALNKRVGESLVIQLKAVWVVWVLCYVIVVKEDYYSTGMF